MGEGEDILYLASFWRAPFMVKLRLTTELTDGDCESAVLRVPEHRLGPR
jgi:hypothetical protein